MTKREREKERTEQIRNATKEVHAAALCLAAAREKLSEAKQWYDNKVAKLRHLKGADEHVARVEEGE